MKRYLKAIGVVLGLIILWQLALGIVCAGYAFIYGIYQSSQTGKIVSEALATQHINDNMYTIGLIGEVLLLIALIPIIKEKLVKKGDFKKINSNTVTNMFILGIGMYGIVALISIPLSIIFPSYLEVSKSISNATGSYIQLFSIVICAPIFEEIFFRGFIFGYLKKNFNFIGAIIVQALVFGIVHGNIVQGIYAFILGIVLAIVYVHYESLFACIIVHIVTNFFGSVVNGFLVSKINSEVIIITIFVIIAVVCIYIPGTKMYKEHKSKVNEKISIE